MRQRKSTRSMMKKQKVSGCLEMNSFNFYTKKTCQSNEKKIESGLIVRDNPISIYLKRNSNLKKYGRFNIKEIGDTSE
jgi:hypothetical protein